MTVQEGYTDYNRFADFWRYNIGVNVIPADTKLKRTYVPWGQWQDKPISEEIHNQWKSDNSFTNGIAVVLGKVWFVPELEGYYLVGVDADNRKAIDEICSHNGKTMTLQELAKKTLIEQHKDNPDKAHFYFYGTRPIKGKSSDKAVLGEKIESGEIPAIEIKSLGSHGILYCSPSVHKNGFSYEIIGVDKPVRLDETQTFELEKHFDNILQKYGIEYLSNSNEIAGKALTPIQELFKPGHYVLKGHNRHEDLLRVMESLIARNKDVLPLDQIKEIARKHNSMEFYEEPLSEVDFDRLWKQAVRFIESKNENKAEDSSNDDEESDKNKIQRLVDSIMKEHIFVTMTDNEQTYCFNGKIYLPDQEWIIKEKCRLIEPKIKTYEIQEVINYIKDSTYRSREIFDSNPDFIVLENGILNIHILELKPHSPNHCSLSMLPVRYNPEAQCPQFSKFLNDILLSDKKQVNTMLQFIGYCLYNSAKFEKAALFIGKGDNGKSTLLNALDIFFGRQNISHTSLQDLSGGNRYAAADLYGKMVNTFADLKAEKLKDTGPFKMLVSGDWCRAERKYGQPFHFQNRAKLIFSCNTIPQSNDTGYAYFKRWLIFHFQRVFTGEERDTRLLDNITTPEELSGLLNLALQSLRKLIEDNGFVDADNIETVEETYETNSSTVAEFVHDTCKITKDGDEEAYVVCRDLYDFYVKYCKDTNLTRKDDNVFGSELALLNIKKARIRVNGEKEYVYFIRYLGAGASEDKREGLGFGFGQMS
jgi:P4 family phage/plasmid primase-like protien